MSADLSRIGVTAKMAAYYRQFSDIPFAAEAARRIGADDAFEQIVRDHGLNRDKLAFYAPMFEARYKSLTQLIRKSGGSQILELASGYSLRGLDLTQSRSIHYVETDLQDVVATKLALLDGLRQEHGVVPSPRHVVTAADALDLEQVRAAAGGFDRGEPLVVLCEGLIGYLTRQETEHIAANVRELLGAFRGGSWLCPDFSFRVEVRSLPPERLRLREAVTGITRRRLDASAFEDPGDLAAFLDRFGFDVAVRSQVDETPAFSSLRALGLPPACLDPLRPALRVWVMTPKPNS